MAWHQYFHATRRNGPLWVLTVFEPSQSPCCFLLFQSHPNPARTAVCTPSETWGWERGAKTQIFAADSTRREGAASCSLSSVLLFASALGLSPLPFSSPAALGDKDTACLPDPSSSAPGWWRGGGRQSPSRAVHLLERGTQKRQHPPGWGAGGYPL